MFPEQYRNPNTWVSENDLEWRVGARNAILKALRNKRLIVFSSQLWRLSDWKSLSNKKKCSVELHFVFWELIWSFAFALLVDYMSGQTLKIQWSEMICIAGETRISFQFDLKLALNISSVLLLCFLCELTLLLQVVNDNASHCCPDEHGTT